MLKTALNLILPPRCICNSILLDSKASLCSGCWNSIGFLSSNICTKCGDPFEFDMGANMLCSNCISAEPHFDKARSVFKYNEISGRIITGLKYSDRLPYAGMIAKWLVPKLNEFENIDIITSVPVHKSSLKKRKYNQSAIIANKLARDINSRADNMILIKARDIALRPA